MSVVFSTVLLLCLVSSTHAITCNAMKDLPEVTRANCIASCKAQNCATGYCEQRKLRATCVCSRCDRGPGLPSINVKGKGKGG